MLYKLTTQDNLTRAGEANETVWGPGVTNSAKLAGKALCTAAVIHAYTGAALALMMNPRHANIKNPKLWECSGEVIASDKGLKVGVKTLTTHRETPLPKVETKHRVFFAIMCAKVVYGGNSVVWDEWSAKYLSGVDRSRTSALNARKAAADAADDAYDAYAADAAAYAAYAAAYAADDAYAAAAAYAAYAAAYAYDAAYDAAYAAAAYAYELIDLAKLAEEAIKIE